MFDVRKWLFPLYIQPDSLCRVLIRFWGWTNQVLSSWSAKLSDFFEQILHPLLTQAFRNMISEGMPLSSLRMRMTVVDFLSEKNSFDTTAPKTSQIRSLNTPNKTYEFFPPLG